MSATLNDVTNKKPAEESAKQQAATELVRLAKEQGLSLTGPDGLLKALTKSVLETALNEEMTEHLGFEKHAPPGAGSGNIRNGTRGKTVLTEATGHVEIDVPRDRAGATRVLSSSWPGATDAPQACCSVAVHPLRIDEHGGATLRGHHPVVFGPVVMGTACSGEYVAEQQSQPFGVQPRLRIVGSGKLGVTFDGGPLPATAKRRCHLGPDAKVGKFHPASGYECQDLFASDRMRHPSGVDQAGLNARVGPQRRDHRQSPLRSRELKYVLQCGHATPSSRSWRTSCRGR